MHTDDLHRPLYCADILVNALNQDPARPLLHLLDGPTLTVGQMRDAISQFAQALRSLGVKAGTRVGLMRLGYSGGTTGKPKSLASVQRVGLATLSIMMAEWEWPNPPRMLACTPLSHAGAALFLPTLLKNGTILVLPRFDPVAVRVGQTVTAEELMARVAQRKGSFQAPQTVEFIDSIPQTAVGKPDKKVLRAKYGSTP